MSEIVKEIIAPAINSLNGVIRAGNLQIQNEASYQHSLALKFHLKAIEQEINFQIELEKRVEHPNHGFIKSGGKKADIDIYIEACDERLAIELKFFRRENHREPNNRYDAFSDLHNLEQYIQIGEATDGLFLLLTDHPHYYSPEFRAHSANTEDFNLRDGSAVEAGQPLAYNTAKPYGEPISLLNGYQFNWLPVHKDWRLLVVEVPPKRKD